jgi:hypothetical protein
LEGVLKFELEFRDHSLNKLHNAMVFEQLVPLPDNGDMAVVDKSVFKVERRIVRYESDDHIKVVLICTPVRDATIHNQGDS